MRHAPERNEISWRVIFSDAAFVDAQDHIKHPMQAILHGPMAANERADQACSQRQGGDIESGLLLDLVPNFTCALDHDDAFQSWPIVAFLQPGDILNNCIDSGFDTAMIAIDGLVAGDLCVLESVGFLLGGKPAEQASSRLSGLYRRLSQLQPEPRACTARALRSTDIGLSPAAGDRSSP
jgi:hypothetical protein